MVVDTKFYDLLGVSPNADDNEIKQGYKQKARELHPDKNRDDPQATEKFQELNYAYEVLKDRQKRAIYDKFGPEGLKDNFNPFRPKPQPQRRQRTKDIIYKLEVTLEDLYNGKETKLRINRNIICPECKGNGCQKDKTPQKCPECGGSGQKVFVRRMGPIIIGQQVSTCQFCQGSGEKIDHADRCLNCGGRKVVNEKKIIEVHIEPGMEDGDKIPFIGSSDENPGFDTGDVVVILKMKPNHHFLRKHDDLLIEKNISLSESLFGASFVIEHLDGRKLVVETQKNKVIEPDSVHVIEREGMPQRGNRFEKGKLYVKFNVKFPKSEDLSEKLRADLIECLPPLNKTDDVDMNDENVYKVGTDESNIKQFQNAKSSYRERRGEAYDTNDDYEPRGGTRAQCQPM